MTITDGQAVIHEILYGSTATYRGGVNALGEVSALRPPDRMVTGTMHDSTFTGQHVHGHGFNRCHYSVQMQKATGRTAFDGEYIGVSRESSKTASAPGAECPPNHVPAPLTIINGIVLGLWQGSVSPQGAVVMRNPKFSRVDAQIGLAAPLRGNLAIRLAPSPLYGASNPADRSPYRPRRRSMKATAASSPP